MKLTVRVKVIQMRWGRWIAKSMTRVRGIMTRSQKDSGWLTGIVITRRWDSEIDYYWDWLIHSY